MSKHCFFAPSEGHIWVNCPYMLKLKKKHEYELAKPAGEAAGHGTLMHQIVSEIINKLIEIQKSNNIFDVEQIYKAIEFYLEGKENIKDRDKEIILKEITPWLIDNVINITENMDKVHSERCYDNNQYFGTIDLNYIDSNNIINVVDFKFGQIYVEVKNNLQLMLYDILILDHYHLWYPDIKICNTIYQPTAFNESGEPNISSCTVDIGELRNLKSNIKEIIDEFNNNLETSKLFKKGIVGNHCLYCKYKCRCSAAFKDSKLFTKALMMNENTGLDPKIVSKNIDKINVIMKFCREYIDFISEKAEEGILPLDDYTIIKTRRDKFNELQSKEIKEILTKNGINPMEEKLKSVASLKKLPQYENIKDQLAPYIETTYSKPFLKKKGGK